MCPDDAPCCIPGILNVSVLPSPRVISLFAVADDAWAFCPMIILLTPPVRLEPALCPTAVWFVKPKNTVQYLFRLLCKFSCTHILLLTYLVICLILFYMYLNLCAYVNKVIALNWSYSLIFIVPFYIMSDCPSVGWSRHRTLTVYTRVKQKI